MARFKWLLKVLQQLYRMGFRCISHEVNMTVRSKDKFIETRRKIIFKHKNGYCGKLKRNVWMYRWRTNQGLLATTPSSKSYLWKTQCGVSLTRLWLTSENWSLVAVTLLVQVARCFSLAKRSKCHEKIFCVYIEKECTLVYVHGEYIPFCTLCLFSYKPWQHPYMTSGSWKLKDDIRQKLSILTRAQLCCLLPRKSSTAGKKSTIEQQV